MPPLSLALPDAASLPRATGRRLPAPRRRSPSPFPALPDAASFPDPATTDNTTGTMAVAPHQIHELLSLNRPVYGVQRCNHMPFNLIVVETPLLVLVATHPGVARPLGSPPLRSAVQPGRPRPFTVTAPRPTVSSHLPPAPWAPVCVPYPSRKIWWPSASNLSLMGILCLHHREPDPTCCVVTATTSIGASCREHTKWICASGRSGNSRLGWHQGLGSILES